MIEPELIPPVPEEVAAEIRLACTCPYPDPDPASVFFLPGWHAATECRARGLLLAHWESWRSAGRIRSSNAPEWTAPWSTLGER